MPDWRVRWRDLVGTAPGADAPASVLRLDALIAGDPPAPDDPAWADAVVDALGAPPLAAQAVELLGAALRATPDRAAAADPAAHDAAPVDPAARAAALRLWRRLASCHPDDPLVLAELGDAERSVGDPARGLALLLDAVDLRPGLFVEFGWDLEDEARAAGPDAWRRWQLQQLRWMVQAAEEHPGSGDEARELYGALLDEHRGDPAALEALRPLGETIQRLEATGALPRAMVVRQRRRPGAS